MANKIRLINCLCGNWEEMSISDPAENSKSFRMVSYQDNNEALYQCECGNKVLSKCMEVSLQDIGKGAA